MLAGLILCGGASRRMKSPKAWLELGHETLLNRCVRVASGVCERVFVIAGPDQQLPVLPDEVFIGRDKIEYGGPARALLNALLNFEVICDHVFVTGCDYPFVTAELVQLMARQAAPDSAVVAEVSGTVQPLPAIYPVMATRRLSDAKSMKDLLAHLSVTVINESDLRHVDPEFAAFRPINTPDDFEWAIHHAASSAICKPD